MRESKEPVAFGRRASNTELKSPSKRRIWLLIAQIGAASPWALALQAGYTTLLSCTTKFEVTTVGALLVAIIVSCGLALIKQSTLCAFFLLLIAVLLSYFGLSHWRELLGMGIDRLLSSIATNSCMCLSAAALVYLTRQSKSE